MSRGALRFTEEQYRTHAAKSDRFKVGTVNRPAADTPAAPPPASGGASKPKPLDVYKLIDYEYPPEMAKMIARPSKYGNVKTNGYASIKESKRAFQLKLMQEAGQIRNLREQVSYLLIPKQEGERACKYVADFVYEAWNTAIWLPVVEDCKGYRTEIYKIKRKLMLMVHGIRVHET